jgi:hypothetical protein
MFGNKAIPSVVWDAPVHVLPCSNSAMKGDNGADRIPRYCCQNHHRTSPVWVPLLGACTPDWVLPKRKPFMKQGAA